MIETRQTVQDAIKEIQETLDTHGEDKAIALFVARAGELDWSQDELDQAIAVIRSPVTPTSGRVGAPN